MRQSRAISAQVASHFWPVYVLQAKTAALLGCVSLCLMPVFYTGKKQTKKDKKKKKALLWKPNQKKTTHFNVGTIYFVSKYILYS